MTIVLATLTYEDGGSDLYQVPLSAYDEPQDRLQHALVTVLDGRHVYDALHDRAATQLWLEAFDRAADPRHRRAGDHA